MERRRVARPEPDEFLDDSGSGGVITTAADLGRWLGFHTGDGRPLVTRGGLETMHAPGPIHPYGMGWSADGESGLLVHSGNLSTYNAVQAISPGTGYGFAVMTDSAGLTDETYAVAMGLAAMSEGRTPEVPGGDRVTSELVPAAIALLSAGLSGPSPGPRSPTSPPVAVRRETITPAPRCTRGDESSSRLGLAGSGRTSDAEDTPDK
ncbi:serine hydrolase [Nonomuraea sp. CA-218870]|uniref:serine hydrolase n=1 Tax=Nonomuraea sp. CA-218870 TaxID=3239998 RepID=UPI003D92DB0C